MSKFTKRRPSRRVTDRSATTDVVTQFECAIRNPQAAALGAVIGGLIPWFGRTLAHEEVPASWSVGHHSLAIAMIAVVLGCACFSAISVYKFGKAAFGDARKALGFVLALEGVMLVSSGATSAVALAVLIAINAIANGSVIALARDATRRRCEADARRAVTRARSRGVPVTPFQVPSTLKRARRPVGVGVPGHGLVAPVRWARATLVDAVDAEIVSEESLLS